MGFDSFPVPTNSWYIETANKWSAIEELYEACWERLDATGRAKTSLTETWVVFDYIQTNAIGLYTNIVYVNKNVTTTNQFGEFTYLTTGGSSRTGMVAVTTDTIGNIDTMINIIIADFAPGSLVTNSMDEYFNLSYSNNIVVSSLTTNTVDVYPKLFETQEETWGNLLYQTGVGAVLNPITNAFGFVTNSPFARFTRMPLATNVLPLAEWYWQGTWASNFITEVTKNSRDWLWTNVFPEIRYDVGTNTFAGNFTVSIKGTAFKNSQEVSASEVVVVNSTNAIPLTNQWTDINIITTTLSGGTPHTNDTISVKYNTEYAIFNEKVVSASYNLYANDLNERKKVLSALLWTYSSANWQSSTPSNQWNAVANNKPSYAEAVASNLLDWAQFASSANDLGARLTLRNSEDIGWDVNSSKEKIADYIITSGDLGTNTTKISELYSYEVDRYWGRWIQSDQTNYYIPSDFDGLAEGTRDINKTYLIVTTNSGLSATSTWDTATFQLTVNPTTQTGIEPTYNNQKFYYQSILYGSLPVLTGARGYAGWFNKWDFVYK